LKTGFLLCGAALVAVGCAKEPRDYSGPYEALSGPSCEMTLGDNLVFTILPVAIGEQTSYSLKSEIPVPHFPSTSKPAAPAPDGSLTFVYEMSDSGMLVDTRGSLTVGFKPHPTDDELLLLDQWDVQSVASTGHSASTSLFDQMANSGRSLDELYSTSPPVMCIGRVTRMPYEERQHKIAGLQVEAAFAKAEAERIAQEKQAAAEAQRAQDLAKEEAERAAAEARYTEMSFDDLWSDRHACKGDRWTVDCQAYKSVLAERSTEEYELQLAGFASIGVQQLTEIIDECGFDRSPGTATPRCRAAQAVAEGRQQDAIEADRQRFMAMSYDEYIQALADCHLISAYACDMLGGMSRQRHKQEVARLQTELSGQELFDLRDDACQTGGKTRNSERCKMLREAAQPARTAERKRLEGDKDAFIAAWNTCADEYAELAAQGHRRNSDEVRALTQRFQCVTATDAKRVWGVKGDFRKRVSGG
ncbi:MAG: hypothetical protein AAGF57_08495, partial [Pseudomonadota bacterium]